MVILALREQTNNGGNLRQASCISTSQIHSSDIITKRDNPFLTKLNLRVYVHTEARNPISDNKLNLYSYIKPTQKSYGGDTGQYAVPNHTRRWIRDKVMADVKRRIPKTVSEIDFG